MFFLTGMGKVFHILDDEQEGSAPLPCGMRLDNYSLWMLQSGKLALNVFREKPADGMLCKKCERGSRGRSL